MWSSFECKETSMRRTEGRVKLSNLRRLVRREGQAGLTKSLVPRPGLVSDRRVRSPPLTPVIVTYPTDPSLPIYPERRVRSAATSTSLCLSRSLGTNRGFSPSYHHSEVSSHHLANGSRRIHPNRSVPLTFNPSRTRAYASHPECHTTESLRHPPPRSYSSTLASVEVADDADPRTEI